MPRDIQAGEHKVLSSCPPHCTVELRINDTPQTPGVYLGLFADDTYIYATDRKEGYVLRKLQRGLSAIETWCKRWNIKVNEDKPQAIYFSHRLKPPEAHITLNIQNIPFVHHVKYLSVIFDKKFFQGAHQSAFCTQLSTFLMYTTV
jgi:hypothetical protein